MKAASEYISIGANRSSSCAICTPKGRTVYGAGRFVAIWDAQSTSRGIQRTLKGHLGQVTTVKLVSEEEAECIVVSGDSTGEVRIWNLDATDGASSLSIKAHNGSISAIGVTGALGHLPNHLFTGGSDGLIKLWNLKDTSKPVQTIELKGKLPLDLEAGSLPGSGATMLVAGLTDRRIRIYTFNAGRFDHAISLEGHEDWVRCLAITDYPSAIDGAKDLLLASGSQDNYVRLWRIAQVAERTTESEATATGDGLDMLDEFERKLAGEAGGNVQISTKAHVLAVESENGPLRYNVTLEALLVGHEGGLTNVHWSPPAADHDPLLLSTASDNSLILWTPSSSSTAKDGIWIPDQRFGATGGRGLGFHGALWGADGKTVMATGWTGGIERWTEIEKGVWEPTSGLSGHFGSVESCVWDQNGDYLLSVGSDQTSRIHASTRLSDHDLWTEIARPQIHGYDMTDAAFISPYRFASTGDEKVTRAFDAPGGFVESLHSLGVSAQSQDSSSRPKGATVPPLGLSNRALGRAAEVSDLPTPSVANPAIDSVSKAFATLPTEEELATTTLWPEVEKIYGHGYELVTLAASHDGSLIATACRASNTEHAVVRVVSTDTWDSVGVPLSGHSLTITRIAFSPDDSKILTCSRDRGWRLYQRKADQAQGYELLAQDEKAHSRMVLNCCWSPDGTFFATASRDKSVKIWSLGEDGIWAAKSTIKLTESVTAVDMIGQGSKIVLAVGTETGSISIYEVTAGSLEGVLQLAIDPAESHCMTINRLAFRPAKDGLLLASCSEDRSIRLFSLET